MNPAPPRMIGAALDTEERMVELNPRQYEALRTIMNEAELHENMWACANTLEFWRRVRSALPARQLRMLDAQLKACQPRPMKGAP